MTEEAEKAARFDMLVRLKRTKERLTVLRDQREKIGQALREFGAVLENASWEFVVQEGKIIGRSTDRAAFGATLVVTQSNVGKDVTELLQQIQEAETLSQEQARLVRKAGLEA